MPLNDPSGKAQTALLRKSLKQIESKVSGKHAKSLDGKQLVSEREIIITSPIKIVHPTDSIVLPTAVSLKGQGATWHL